MGNIQLDSEQIAKSWAGGSVFLLFQPLTVCFGIPVDSQKSF